MPRVAVDRAAQPHVLAICLRGNMSSAARRQSSLCVGPSAGGARWVARQRLTAGEQSTFVSALAQFQNDSGALQQKSRQNSSRSSWQSVTVQSYAGEYGFNGRMHSYWWPLDRFWRSGRPGLLCSRDAAIQAKLYPRRPKTTFTGCVCDNVPVQFSA
jgi:hypothetical protein